MRNINFIYFDVGGVILLFEHAYDEISKRTGKSFDEVGKVVDKYAALRKANSAGLLEDYKRELGLSFDTYDEFIKFYTNAFVPLKETHCLIKKLIKTYPVGLFSNSEPKVIETSIKLGKIPDLPYKSMIISCYVGYRKPDREIYLLAQAEAGTEPNKILLIDDKQENLKTADVLGWKTILFNSRTPKISIDLIENSLKQ